MICEYFEKCLILCMVSAKHSLNLSRLGKLFVLNVLWLGKRKPERQTGPINQTLSIIQALIELARNYFRKKKTAVKLIY